MVGVAATTEQRQTDWTAGGGTQDRARVG